MACCDKLCEEKQRSIVYGTKNKTHITIEKYIIDKFRFVLIPRRIDKLLILSKLIMFQKYIFDYWIWYVFFDLDCHV